MLEDPSETAAGGDFMSSTSTPSAWQLPPILFPVQVEAAEEGRAETVPPSSLPTPKSTPKSTSPAPSTPPPLTPPPPLYSIFDDWQKKLIVVVVSIAASFSGLSSNIYFPALPTLAHDFNVSSELINLTVTSYLILQGIAPSLWAPLSDVKGRRVAYICIFTIYLGACIGLAESRNYASLLVLRSLQSAGSASAIAIGAGVIGDITTREERGGVMGIFQAGSLGVLAIGPIIGGALAGTLGWRSIFWFLTIYSGAFLFCLIVLLPETLRSVVANGSRTPDSLILRYPLVFYQKLTKIPDALAKDGPSKPDEKKQVDLTGSFRVLVSPGVAPLNIFNAIHYAVWQMSVTAMSTLFEERYRLKETQIGLTFIANGAGCIIGTFVTGKILDFDYRRFKSRYKAQTAAQSPRQNDDQRPDAAGQNAGSNRKRSNNDNDDVDDQFPLKKARMRLVPVFSLIQTIFIILFGWSIQFHRLIPIAIPIISTFVLGWTFASTQGAVMTYLVDVFPDKSAAASASLNLLRCLFAAGGTSIVMPLVNSIGVGWTFTVCAGVQVLTLLSLLVIG